MPDQEESAPPVDSSTKALNDDWEDSPSPSLNATSTSTMSGGTTVLTGIQEHKSGGAVTEHREVSAVGELGVIETGLEHVAASRRGSRSSYQISDVNSVMGDRSAMTGGTLAKPGRCVVRKCTIAVRGGPRGQTREKVLLHPMKVDLPNASMTAIIGPAGSGRRTLMKFLSGTMRGSVYKNGSVCCEGGVNLPGTKSYLGEETNLHGFYTCQTYLKHYDRLTTGLRKGCKSQNEIDGLLKSLGILEDRKGVVVGDLFRRGLSRSERRRLDLALMVLGAPDTLFCEQPDGSLDSETALSVMQFLKGYCSQPGRRVIVTLNKPSSLIWNLVDNVILISEGMVIYEGPRFDMESFFAYNQCPTPKRFSQVEHYLATVSSVGNRKEKRSVEEWAESFKKWQEAADEDEGDVLADDIETCFPSVIGEVVISRAAAQKSKYIRRKRIFFELTRRYFLDLFLNPGMLWVRFAMYFMLGLFIGLLFRGLGDRTSSMSILSRSSVLFYSVSFFIFMVVAVIPFRCHDKAVVEKEIFNGYYHPLAHHFASTIASLVGVLILTFVTTVVMVPMAKFHSPFKFFLNMLLSLNCAEALAQMVTLLVSNFIVGIVALAGLFGFFMLLMGFMLVPSEFPTWLRWAYHVPFHTYAWRSFMYSEFSGPENVFDSVEFPTGMDVLKSYEIDQVNFDNDMIVLFFYSLIIHLVSTAIITVRHKTNRKIGEDDQSDDAIRKFGAGILLYGARHLVPQDIARHLVPSSQTGSSHAD